MSICIYIIQLLFTVYTVYLFIYLLFFLKGAHTNIYIYNNNNSNDNNDNSHDNNNNDNNNNSNNNAYVDRLMHVTS